MLPSLHGWCPEAPTLPSRTAILGTPCRTSDTSEGHARIRLLFGSKDSLVQDLGSCHGLWHLPRPSPCGQSPARPVLLALSPKSSSRAAPKLPVKGCKGVSWVSGSFTWSGHLHQFGISRRALVARNRHQNHLQPVCALEGRSCHGVLC